MPNTLPKKRKKSKESILVNALSFLVLFPMLLLILPTVVFLALSMIPTLCALIFDSDTKLKLKYKWLCIGGLNFAGALPFLFQLWFGENELDSAIALFLSHLTFIVIYLAAFVGWLFYRWIPPVVSNVLEVNDQRRVTYLRGLQEKLLSKWGEKIKETSEVKKR